MGRPRKGDRVQGPYCDKQGWHYSIITGGESTHHRCDDGTSEKEARALVKGLRVEVERAAAELTVVEAVDAYVDAYVNDGADRKKTGSFEKTAVRWLTDKYGDLPIRGLQTRHIAAYLDALPSLPARQKKDKEGNPAPISMATCRSYWKAMRRTSAWWRSQTLTNTDLAAEVLEKRKKDKKKLPWQSKMGTKKLNRGKPQLRNLTEVEAYLGTALQDEDAERRVAATLPLLSGLSSGEVRHLTRSQIDLKARCLWIRSEEDSEDLDLSSWEVKTANRVRTAEMPECLVEDLSSLCKGKAPTELLFQQQDTVGATPGQRRSRGWLLDLVKSVCRRAGTRVVSAHGLRDTYSSVRRVLYRETSEDIGVRLGHGRGDRGKTAEAHYIGAPDKVPAIHVTVSRKSVGTSEGRGEREQAGGCVQEDLRESFVT